MCGSDTLTIVVSSTSMNAASVTTTAISQGLALGRQFWTSLLGVPAPVAVGAAWDSLKRGSLQAHRGLGGEDER